jgi:GTP cyclohydrolase II
MQDLQHIGSHHLRTAAGDFRLHGFKWDHNRRLALALYTELMPNRSPLVRVQLSCAYSEALLSVDCDCHRQIEAALRLIRDQSGVFIYFPDTDARGLGLDMKVLLSEAEEKIGQPPYRTARSVGLNYSDLSCLKMVGPILEYMGVKQPIRLLSNSPQKEAVLKEHSVIVESLVRLPVDTHGLSTVALAELREKEGVRHQSFCSPESSSGRPTGA